MLLDLAKVKRGSLAVNFMSDGRTYVRQTAGTEIAKYIPTKFAGKDRTDWVLSLGFSLRRSSARSARASTGRWTGARCARAPRSGEPS